MHSDILKDLQIVVVDDEEVNLALLDALLKIDNYTHVKIFLDPTEALLYLEANHCDILIVDYNMPKMDGITLVKKVKSFSSHILSIMVTSNENEQIMLNALAAGINEFLVKPISSISFALRLKNMTHLAAAYKITHDFNIQLEARVKDAVKELKKREFEALEVLSKAAEYKDPETAFHIARVSHYAKLIASKIGLSEEEQEIIFYAAPLHDLGKIGIADDILLKPGKLTADEFCSMQKHTNIGSGILKGKDNKYLLAGEKIANSHHEKYDGSGYPNGLEGEDIPLYGRIVAIADVFDALTTVRPYKKAWPFEDALNYIIENKAQHFDPKLVDIFVKYIDDVKIIYQQFR